MLPVAYGRVAGWPRSQGCPGWMGWWQRRQMMVVVAMRCDQWVRWFRMWRGVPLRRLVVTCAWYLPFWVIGCCSGGVFAGRARGLWLVCGLK